MANNKTLSGRILKNGCYYEHENSKMIVAINPYGYIKSNSIKSENYQEERHIKGL